MLGQDEGAINLRTAINNLDTAAVTYFVKERDILIKVVHFPLCQDSKSRRQNLIGNCHFILLGLESVRALPCPCRGVLPWVAR